MDTCTLDARIVVSELFSSFDDQPMEHQIELVDALEEFLNTWMIKHGLNGFVSQPTKQWKHQMSSLVGSESHDCNVLSLFTNSKLFQRLLCIGVGANDLCKLQEGDGSPAATATPDDGWLTSLHGRNIGSKSAHSSDTEAMEYEDIDRYLVTVDSAAVAKDMMERRPLGGSASKLIKSRRARGLCYDEQGSPSLMYREHDPDFTVGQKLSLKIKRRYTRQKKLKPNGGASRAKETAEGDEAKSQKTRVVKIIDPVKTNDVENSEPDYVRDVDGVMKFKCGVCGVLFARIWHLRRHIKLHYGYKPHTCPSCPKTFARAEHLRKHMLRHSGSRTFRPHICRHCLSEFSVGRELKEHVKTEHAPALVNGAARPKHKHQCGKCEEIFPDAAQLRKHVRRAHTGGTPENSFMCAECGQMFTRLGHLRRHTRLHTGDKPFMCNRCACQFARADHLRRHLQAHHADDPSLRPKDPNFPANIKLDLDGIPTSGDNLPLIGVLDGNGPGEKEAALNLPVFPGPGEEKFDNPSLKPRPRDSEPVPESGDNLSGFSLLPAGGSRPSEIRTAESLPVFPGRGVEKLTTSENQSTYQAVDMMTDVHSGRLDDGKLVTNKDRSRTTTPGSSVSYVASTGASLPVFPGHREEKSTTHYPRVEIPAELKNPRLDGRKSASVEDCDRIAVASRFHESNSTSTISPADHRNFAVSGDSAAFRADFWHRTSPAYMNDRLFLARAANLRHFDVDFSRSSESVPTNLAHHRYSQSHPMMPGNFISSVVDYRRLPPENPAVTSQQTDAAIPDASPLSLARYQRK